MAIVLICTLAFSTAGQAQDRQPLPKKQSLKDRITHSRAFETVIWSVPLMNYKAMRDAYEKEAGVGYNDVAYHSKIQTWELEIPTPNNTTPYVIAYWTVKDGPVVVEIPAVTKDVSLFGVMMDSWQRPIGPVGALGSG